MKSNNKKKITRDNKRRFIQYNEWMFRMYPELHDAKNLIKHKERYKKLDLLSRQFTFQVTDKCNLACTYCYQINKSTRRMKIEDAKKAVDNLLTGENGFDAYINPVISPAIEIEFIGGEPFLEVDLIDEVTDYFIQRAIELNHPWQHNYVISICSNGVLYKDPRVQNYINKHKRHLSLSITVDGVQELHDKCRIFPDGKPSYHLAHSAALDWMDRGNYLGSKITIAPANVTYVADSMKQMIDDGYYDINANFVYEEGWNKEHAKEIYNQIKRFTDETLYDFDINAVAISLLNSNGQPKSVIENTNWCGGTGSMLAMDPDGGLYPCIRYMESSLGPNIKPLKIGDIHTGLLIDKCDRDCFSCMNGINRRSQSTDECYFCPVADGCGWCSGYNYQVFGTVNKRATFTCIMHKARSLCTAYYVNRHKQSGDDIAAFDIWLPKDECIDIIGEDWYNELVELTKSVGGKVNETGFNAVFYNGESDIIKDFDDVHPDGTNVETFRLDDEEALSKYREKTKELLDKEDEAYKQSKEEEKK